MTTPTEKTKILIAEDEIVAQQLFKIGFRDPCFEIKIVPDGEEAMIVYNAWKPDIILLDILMPLKNGYQTLREIRSVLHDNATSVIMVSSVSEKEDILACAKLGIQGYVLKPINSKKIADTVLKYHRQNIQKSS